MSGGREKRRNPRVPIQFKVRVDTVRGTFNGVGRDISEGGIGVYLKKLPPIGSQVDLSFQLPGNQDGLEATGEVMYHSRGEAGVRDDWMGIRFMRMDPVSLGYIQRYVKSNSDKIRQFGSKPPPLPR